MVNIDLEKFIVDVVEGLSTRTNVSAVAAAYQEALRKQNMTVKDGHLCIIQPKFKVGNRIRLKDYHDIQHTIKEVGRDYYITTDDRRLDMQNDDNYELVPDEQKTDNSYINYLYSKFYRNKEIEWLTKQK